jgi:A/G-specific adenine glycosylase
MIPRVKKFQTEVWEHYRTHKRDLPWRRTKDPYKILVSEVMLQQTQVERVKGYYEIFLKKFPNVQTLAKASLSEVFILWKGLGYNRRAAHLKRCAEEIVKNGGTFPKTYEELLKLPGIGPSTAGALMNFSYNIPTAFIETNIRTVYLHFFFKDKMGVSDSCLMGTILQTQDQTNPREWYYALYDYGVMLKKTIGNQNARSKHYKKQSAFAGSNRELRAKMLFYILEERKVTLPQLVKELKRNKEEIEKNLAAFVKEGVMRKKGAYFELQEDAHA